MKRLEVVDLEKDVLEGEYLEIPVIIHLKNGTIIEDKIDEYTYDDEPFENFIVIKNEMISFNDIEYIKVK